VKADNQIGEAIARPVLPENADPITLRYWWKVISQDPQPQSDILDVMVEPCPVSKPRSQRREIGWLALRRSDVAEAGRWDCPPGESHETL